MLLTIDLLLSNPDIVKAILDRTMQMNYDKIRWKRYLKAHESSSPTFKMATGVVSRVVVGTMIDSYANKPLRGRKNIGSGVGEVGSFGDAFQMDNYRMDELLKLIKKFNALGTREQNTMINEIVNFLVDDYKQVYLAPMLAIDKMIGDARSRGKYIVSINGSDAREINLPVNTFVPTNEDRNHIVSYLSDKIEDLKDLGIYPTAIQMTRKTFRNRVVKSSEFINTYKLKFDSMDIDPASIITVDMVNKLLSASDIDVPIEIVDERVELPNGEVYKSFADDKICLLPGNDLGTLEYYKSSEWSDPVPGKNYSQAENGMVLVSSQRTDEGRFLDYFMNSAPNLSAPKKISIVDLSDDVA